MGQDAAAAESSRVKRVLSRVRRVSVAGVWGTAVARAVVRRVRGRRTLVRSLIFGGWRGVWTLKGERVVGADRDSYLYRRMATASLAAACISQHPRLCPSVSRIGQ